MLRYCPYPSIPLTDGWYRCIVVGIFRQHEHETGIASVCLGRQQHCWNGTHFCYAWGAQSELGTFASSYVPTTTTSATRAADNVSIIGSLDTVLGAVPGSVVISIGPPLTYPDQLRLIGYANGDYRLGLGAPGNPTARTNSVSLTVSVPNLLTDSTTKIATGWDGSGHSLVANGGTVATNAAGQSAESGARLGSTFGGFDGYFFGYIQRLTAWNTRLADATLQGFTAP